MIAQEALKQALMKTSWEHQYEVLQDEIFLASLRGLFEYSTSLNLKEKTKEALIENGFSLEDKQEWINDIPKKYILIKW